MHTNIPEQETPKLNIREACDIFEALVSNDFGIRLSVARAIAANPGKAMSYGSYNGMTLVDYLVQLHNQTSDRSYRTVLLTALAAFGDPRIPDIFMNEMAGSYEPEQVIAAAARLAAEKEEKVRRFMARMLRRNASSTQARMAANIMTGYGDLTPEERVRTAVVADVSFQAPPLDDATEQAWLRELAGDASENARVLLEDCGSDAFLRLRGKWSSLDEQTRAWLVTWGAREHPLYSIELLAHAFAEDASPAVVRAALAGIAGMGQARTLFHTVLAPFVDHADAAIRIAAIRAGAPVSGIRSRIASEKDIDVRVALIPRLPEEPGGLDALLELLYEDRWEIRSAATHTLIGMGVPALEAARSLVTHESEKIRSSVAQIIAAIGA